ncbi:DUF2808 domain-containing protein [Nostoc sp. PA-18-2419]|uniref:DUF2808 domain-containing protein n=1 Tax=Nostoc sp. PA-18-2419 TaxID=2575443 RepID=UPI001107F90E|nr:DUF2808 domain-containing protein [Nostoc sp. PA-18-2419]
MQFHKLVISITLAIAATTAIQSATNTSTKAESISIDQSEQTFFNHPPQLIRAAAPQTARDTSSTYEFTLTVPKDAGQPLKAVKIAQAKNLETIKFDINKSKAFASERFAAGPEIRLASIGGNDQPSTLGEAIVVFDQPVQPGSTVTVALAAQKNPSLDGVYLFGVTAYPVGDNGLGQFLGYGRINFYNN